MTPLTLCLTTAWLRLAGDFMPKPVDYTFPRWALTLHGIAARLNEQHPSQHYGTQFLTWVNSELTAHPNLHVDENTVPPDRNSPLSWYASWVLFAKLPASIQAGIIEGGKLTEIAGKGAIAGLGQATQTLAGNPLDALTSIGDFFSRLTEASTWIRVLEIGAGILIGYVGLKALVTPGSQPVVRQTVKSTGKNIAKVAKKVVK